MSISASWSASVVPYAKSTQHLQALRAQTADDRHIICTEVFNDITGDIDERAQGAALFLPDACLYMCTSQLPAKHQSQKSDGARAEALQAPNYTCFYEVLAPFYKQVRVMIPKGFRMQCEI
jgi:hypothetical protein